MKKFLIIALLAVTSNIASAASDARVQLNKFFSDVQSMQGSFVQQVYSKKGVVTDTAKGQLTLARPGKFRWVYSSPDPQQIISDGRNVWIYDKDLDQVTVKPLTKAMESTPAAILMHKAVPDKHFNILEMNDKANGWNWFYLKPHRKSSDFRAVQMGLDKSGKLKQMVLYDHIGQKTVITFNAVTNARINHNQFNFKPPSGVDVIGKPQ